MEFLTNEKLLIVGAAGMIGSNMAQTAIMMKLTPNICLYDPYAPALKGVAEELLHCGFEGVNITYTSDVKEAFTGAAYIVSSGGAARKAGMTREDLLKGNALIAEEFGKNVRQYCPEVKHVVVVFNPADITGLITLIYSGLKPSQVSTLAALDSTRLRSELAKYFKIPADEIVNSRTYGGHGEQMAVFASTTTVAGQPLSQIIGMEPVTDWALYQRTGLCWHPKYTINRIWQMRRQQEALYAETDCFLSVSDYVLYRLTGQKLTDESLACRTMLYNIHERCWDRELAASAGVSKADAFHLGIACNL